MDLFNYKMFAAKLVTVKDLVSDQRPFFDLLLKFPGKEVDCTVKHFVRLLINTIRVLHQIFADREFRNRASCSVANMLHIVSLKIL